MALIISPGKQLVDAIDFVISNMVEDVGKPDLRINGVVRRGWADGYFWWIGGFTLRRIGSRLT